MKKFTLAIVAIVLGFTMISCGNSEAILETIKTNTDQFFTSGEQRLQNITSAEEFLDFFAKFNEERDVFAEDLFADYIDEEGNIKGFSEEDYNNMLEYISNRATAYNEKEGAKCAEFLTPRLDKLEQSLNDLIENVENYSDEQIQDLVVEVFDAYDDVTMFEDYDNVPVALQERFLDLDDTMQALFAE